MPHYFVGGASAVGHKEAVVSIEDTSGITLALTDCTVVIQKLTQLLHRVTHVGTQHVFTIKLVVHLAHRAL